MKYMGAINNNFYKILAVVLGFLVILIPFFRIDGGLVDDDYYYIKIAESLPNYKLSIFPIGYPIVLKTVNLLFNDYFLSSRFISISSFLFILLFSYFKKFFFRETVLLMSLKFFTVFFYALSETLFIPIFYVLFYAVYQIINNKKDKYLLLAISIFLLVTIRYSGLFVWGGGFVYSIVHYFFFQNEKNQLVFRAFFKSLLLSILLIALFLFLNYYHTGAFFGENQRGASIVQNSNGMEFLIKSVLFPFYIAINPISEIYRFSFFSFILTFLLATIFSILLLFLFFKNIKNHNKLFFVFSWIMMFIYFMGMIYSSYTTGIEAMHFRLNSPIIFILFFITIISVKDVLGKRIILLLAFVSISVNTFYNLNQSFNYLEKRKNVISFYRSLGSPDYYHNDIKIIPTETGGTLTSNFFTLYCVHPNIKKIENIKNQEVDKLNIVFEKQLINIKPINRTSYSNSFSITK